MKAALNAYAQKVAPISVDSLEHIDLCGQHPAIERIDPSSLSTLRSCRRLSLSTNNIDRINGLNALTSLEILSLGRNCVKRLDGIDAVAPSLKELWISYNQIEKFSGGLEHCKKLKVLYASNNKIKEWSEIDRLAQLTCLEDLLLVGNPLYNEHRDAGTLLEYRLKVIKKLPQLKKLDGDLISIEERLSVTKNDANSNSVVSK